VHQIGSVYKIVNICHQIGNVSSEKANRTTSKYHINLLYLRQFVT